MTNGLHWPEEWLKLHSPKRHRFKKRLPTKSYYNTKWRNVAEEILYYMSSQETQKMYSGGILEKTNQSWVRLKEEQSTLWGGGIKMNSARYMPVNR